MLDQRYANKLGRLVDAGWRKLQLGRKSRYRFLQQFTGRFYGSKRGQEMDDMKSSPVNLMWNAVMTYVPNHVANHPQYKLRTNIAQYRPYCRKLELGVNYVAEHEINLRMTLRKAVTNALFGMSVVKTGLASTDQCLAAGDGSSYRIGKTYADAVDMDDLVIDPLARSWEELYIVGNRFRISKDMVLAMGLYDESKIASLQSRYDRPSPDEASMLSDNLNATVLANDVMEFLDLVEVYLPQEQLIVTMPWYANGPSDQIIRAVEYEGPDCGPYKQLGFAFVPDNVIPVPPAGIWYDLHMMANKIARKIGRQADRSKVLLAYEGSAADDALEVQDGDDGETIRVDNIDGLKELNFGGATDDSYKYMDWCQTQFSKMAGNLDMLGGIEDDTATATQAQMLNANSNVRIADSQFLVYEFTKEIGRDIAYFLHTDPLIDLPLTDRVQGVDVQVNYTPEMRQGKWLDYFVAVQPYSMQRQDPNMKLKRKIEFASQVVPAIAQAYVTLAQVGVQMNIQGFLADMAREAGIEEADEIIPFVNQQLAQMYPQQLSPGPKVMGATSQQIMPAMAQAGMIRPPQAPTAGAMGSGFRPQQPNPSATGPSGMATQNTDRNMAAQGMAGDLQSVYRR